MTTPSAKADGFSGKPCGIPRALRPTVESRPVKDISSGVDIPVHAQTAFRAIMPTVTQRFRNHSAAARTSLGGVARIDFLDPATSVCSFVAENIEEATPGGIVNRLGQTSSCQPFDIQIFDGDVEGLGKNGVGLTVQEVCASGGQFTVELSQSSDRLASSGAAFVLASEGALQHPQPSLPFSEEAWSFNRFSVRARDKGIQAHINAQRVDDRRGLCIGGFDRKADKPAPTVARDLGVFDFPPIGYRPMPPYLDATGNANDPQPFPLQPAAIPEGKFSGIPAGTGLKSWESSFLPRFQSTEKGAKGFVQSSQDVLLSGVAPAGELWEFRSQDLQFSGLCAIAEVDAFAVRIHPTFQRGIVEAAKITQQRGQCRVLSRTRIEPVFEGAQHLLPFLVFDVALNRGFGHRPHRGSEVGARPQRGKAGAQKREFLPQDSAAHSLQSVD